MLNTLSCEIGNNLCSLCANPTRIATAIPNDESNQGDCKEENGDREFHERVATPNSEFSEP